MRTAVAALLVAVAAGCGAKTGLEIEEHELDAGFDARVLPPDAGSPPDAGWTCPTEPCDCLAGGTVRWEGVEVCPTFETPGVRSCGLYPGWGDLAWLTASCAGRYTFCARIEGPGCVVGERCGDTWIAGPGARGRVQVRHLTSFGECAAEGALDTGVSVCVRVEWEAGGHRGEQELGCFARFGPWCFDGCTGTGPGPDPAGGEWGFGDDG